MGIKIYKPTTDGRRHSSVDDYADITRTTPEKGLTVGLRKQGGRNMHGQITVRHRGGGTKQSYRLVDFKREKHDITAKVTSIEYDPNRNARIALLAYQDGEKRYIVAPQELGVGMIVVSSVKNKIKASVGNAMPLEAIPLGTFVYNVEIIPGNGGSMARSAGTSIQLAALDGPYAVLKMPSGELRKVFKECMATVGSVSNPGFMNIRWGKAGRTRKRGIRPTVRGKAMNPNDHPHGGGEARNSIGMTHPKTPWGKHALGVKTRKHNKQSNNLIISRRKSKKK